MPIVGMSDKRRIIQHTKSDFTNLSLSFVSAIDT